MSDSSQDNSFSLLGNDVLVYLLKTSIAGFFLGVSTYGAHLFIELGNESKAVAMEAQATAKINHYTELKKLAESDEGLELLSTFNDKYKLPYELAIEEKAVAQKAISQASVNMDLVNSFIKLLFTASFGVFFISGAILACRSDELNKGKFTFTLKNTEIDLVKSLLDKEVKTVNNDPESCAERAKFLNELLKKFQK